MPTEEKDVLSLECVIFMGIQASGKSSFYKEHFFSTHMRINLDMLKTRYRENIYLNASIDAKQPFVVDNTNPTAEERQKYIEIAKRHRFKTIGYYFEPDYDESIRRNARRSGKACIPEKGIRSVLGKLEVPQYTEGFDELYIVRSYEGSFQVDRLD
ncbi:hypothetical protein D3C72_994640 [compost metagenome]